MCQDCLEEICICRQAFDLEFCQGTLRFLNHTGEGQLTSVHNQLSQERIEAWTGLVTGIAKGIDPNTRTERNVKCGEPPATRPHTAIFTHCFHINAHLDGNAARYGGHLTVEPKRLQGLALGKIKLQLD